jgi:hypothetical protein
VPSCRYACNPTINANRQSRGKDASVSASPNRPLVARHRNRHSAERHHTTQSHAVSAGVRPAAVGPPAGAHRRLPADAGLRKLPALKILVLFAITGARLMPAHRRPFISMACKHSILEFGCCLVHMQCPALLSKSLFRVELFHHDKHCFSAACRAPQQPEER